MIFEVLKSEMPLFAEAILSSLEGYSFAMIALEGDLGVGKTTFSKDFARACGVAETVYSPTYSIENEYVSSRESLLLRHVDCYRGLEIFDLEQVFNQKSKFKREFLLIEWFDLIKDLYFKRPDLCLKISLPSDDIEKKRYIEVIGDGKILEKFNQKYPKNS